MRCDLGQARTREPAAFPVIVPAVAPVWVLADEASGCIDAYTDADDPDVTRSIEISGTFDARLQKRSSP